MEQLQSGNMWNETVVQEVGFLILSLFSHSVLSPIFILAFGTFRVRYSLTVL